MTPPALVRSRLRYLAPIAALLAVAVAVSPMEACSNKVCEAPPDEALADVPHLLSETGLYANVHAGETAPRVMRFAPQFTLWSDGAEKRRWILLPEGKRIDTSNMDFWQFPEGTKLWKEFTREGVRVETRLLLKYGPAASDWVGMAYAWYADQSDAVAVPEGVIHTQGTPHNIPAAAECFACHGGTESRVLGFSAIQLSYDAEPGVADLQDAIDRGMLTEPPSRALTVPGDATQRAALGYLHANCGHCHNKRRPTDRGLRCFDPDNPLDFWLRIDRLDSAQSTPTYQTAIGFDVEPGQPDRSGLIDMVSKRPGMPPVATEAVDRTAVELLRRWVAEMPR